MMDADESDMPRSWSHSVMNTRLAYGTLPTTPWRIISEKVGIFMTLPT